MFLSKYGVARHIYLPVIKRAVVDFAVGADWTPATGDVKISKDGGAAANVTNLPAAIAMGNGAIWDFLLTATEMQAAQVVVTVADSATKAVEDQGFVIETYGNASGQHAVDLADSVRAGLTALPNAAAEAAGGLYTRGTGAGQINQPANGMVDANVVRNAGTAITSASGIQEVKVASIAANAITATAIAADAITDAKVASDVTIASVTGAVGSVTGAVGSVTGAVGSVTGAVGSVAGNVGGNVVGSVASVTAGVTLAASAVQAIWDALTSALTTVGSIGKLLVDNITGNAYTRLGAPAGASLAADVAAVKGVLPAALVSGRIDASVGAMAADTLTASALATDSVTEIQTGLSTLTAAGVRTAVGLASANIDTQLSAIAGYIDTEVAAIKAKTDSLTFTVAGKVDSNITAVNSVTVTGVGTSGSPWGP